MKTATTMSLRAIVLLFLVFAGPNVSLAAQSRDAFEVKFGIMTTRPSGESYVSKETRTIPLRHKASGFRWGFTVAHGQRRSFSGYAIYHLPAVPEALTADAAEAETSHGGQVVKTTRQLFQGWGAFTSHFDQGDPAGHWRVDVYVNDHLLKSIDFNVVVK